MRLSLLAMILFGAAALVQPRVAAAQCTFSPPIENGWYSGIPVTAEGTTGWTLDLELDAGLSLDADVAVFWSARAHDTLGAASEWATPWAYRVPGPGGDDDDDVPVGRARGSDPARPATVGWVRLALLPLAASRGRR